MDDNEGRTSTGGIYRTDESGRFTLSKLQPGIYVVTESKAPDGYVLDATPKTVTVNANDAQTVTFRDTPLQTLVIQKYADGTSKPLSGVTFLITDGDGRKIGNGEYVTDENGRVFLDNLEPDLTVIVRETKTVDGYALNGAPQSLILKSGETNAMSFYSNPT